VARIPVLLDCDPGHDDAIAILLALGCPDIDLLAVTTCFGNCSVEDGTRNALQVLELANADVPVAAGASGPLAQQAVLGDYVHGASGLDGPRLPPPRRSPEPITAVELMAATLSTSVVPITVVATGPITNVATLLQTHPELNHRISEIVFMGGSTQRGNHTPAAEFNTYADPEALDICLNSGLPVRMVGLNLTHQALATQEVVARLRSLPGRLGQITSAWMGFFGESYQRVWSFDSPPVHDPCTIAWLARPRLIESTSAFVAVELTGRWTRGMTVVDLDHRLAKPPNCEVALKLNAPGYWNLVLDALTRLAG
jgi:purine nucleosidase/pyrimidine-specific ribonucleoside hydrolase